MYRGCGYVFFLGFPRSVDREESQANVPKSWLEQLLPSWDRMSTIRRDTPIVNSPFPIAFHFEAR